ncbi:MULTISPECIES: DUF3072 domain-containing protein [unclassified Devosia]|uniref:DUF3072 domain-containing protein n=1 Tax=unclassified Devosia TaxID=196773 RepID=UPI0015522B29|nr:MULTISPECIES: DUF3072 domain-containing protein [unclassified Devosia]
MSTTNPKVADAPNSNLQKDPDDWTTGDDPMTGAQASYLKTLSEQASDPDAFAEDLSKAEASKRIDSLREKLGL